MNNDLLLDTDIIVNVGRDRAKAVEQVSALMAAGPVYISAVTEMELVIPILNQGAIFVGSSSTPQHTGCMPSSPQSSPP